MSRIRIKNFGPIKEGCVENDGWIDIKKFTVFIGNQGSGKSTVAKLISTFMWKEKAMNRGDIEPPKSIYEFQGFCKYQGIANYFREGSILEYDGDSLAFKIEYNLPPVIPVENLLRSYITPKIMYVSSERNFLSTIRSAFDVKGLPGHLVGFAEEMKRAQLELINANLELPIGNYVYNYDAFKDASFISGADYHIDLLEASSGLQSLVPLFLVSRNLALSIAKNSNVTENLSVNQLLRRNNSLTQIALRPNISDDERMLLVNKVSASYINSCFINIVEEPEQNLFPTSQRQLLNSLVSFANMTEGNKLIMTTHSPYLINDITLAVKAFKVRETLASQQKNADDKIGKIVPVDSVINPDDLAIYELDEKDGSIKKLGEYKGIPSDENYLNDNLAATNELFAQLLEIEKGWL